MLLLIGGDDLTANGDEIILDVYPRVVTMSTMMRMMMMLMGCMGFSLMSSVALAIAYSQGLLCDFNTYLCPPVKKKAASAETTAACLAYAKSQCTTAKGPDRGPCITKYKKSCPASGPPPVSAANCLLRAQTTCTALGKVEKGRGYCVSKENKACMAENNMAIEAGFKPTAYSANTDCWKSAMLSCAGTSGAAHATCVSDANKGCMAISGNKWTVGSSVPPAPKCVTMYTEPDFMGLSKEFCADQSQFRDNVKTSPDNKSFENRVQSLIVAPGYMAKVWADYNYLGDSWDIPSGSAINNLYDYCRADGVTVPRSAVATGPNVVDSCKNTWTKMIDSVNVISKTT